MKTNEMTRRAFLAATTTTAAVLYSARAQVNTARVVPRKLSPNEKMNIAGIGAGGKGLVDIMGCKDENIVAVCDVDWERGGEAAYRFPEAKKYTDFRKMLEEMDGEIDACTISTPDHTHAPAAYMAMTMGKHVYVQKPLTHTIAEARMLTKLAVETGVVTQMGNQGQCGDGVRELCEMIWSGVIGEVKEAHVWTDRPIWPQGIPEPLPAEDVPEHLDWELWVGPAPMRPYNKEYVPFKWRGWWDFGCGAIGDMACHNMNGAFMSLKLYEAPSFTVEVVQQDGMNAQTAPNNAIIKYSFPARAGMGPVDMYWYDGKLLPARPEGVPEDEKIGDGDNGSIFIGSEGLLTTGTHAEGSRLMPAARMADYAKPEPTLPRIPKGDPYRNWIDACKNGAKAASDFSLAGPLTEIANFGNIALHTGIKLEYDTAAMRITNDEAANRLLTKEYRSGWELPC